MKREKLYCILLLNQAILSVSKLFSRFIPNQCVNVQDREGNTVLRVMGATTRKSIIEWLAKAENASFKRSHHEEVENEQPEAKRQRSDDE